MRLTDKGFAKLTAISDRYSLSHFEEENTIDNIREFMDKMTWLIENTEQVNDEDREWVELLIQKLNEN